MSTVPASHGGTSISETSFMSANQHDAPQSASDKIRSYLRKQMTLSKRRGGWFRLKKRERSLYSLALRIHVKFESVQLVRAMVGILKKLLESSDLAYNRLLRGMSLAWTFSSAGERWGNRGAKAWRNDTDYARYLGAHMCSVGRP
jgi:hypothetical protein